MDILNEIEEIDAGIGQICKGHLLLSHAPKP